MGSVICNEIDVLPTMDRTACISSTIVTYVLGIPEIAQYIVLMMSPRVRATMCRVDKRFYTLVINVTYQTAELRHDTSSGEHSTNYGDCTRTHVIKYTPCKYMTKRSFEINKNDTLSAFATFRNFLHIMNDFHLFMRHINRTSVLILLSERSDHELEIDPDLALFLYRTITHNSRMIYHLYRHGIDVVQAKIIGELFKHNGYIIHTCEFTNTTFTLAFRGAARGGHIELMNDLLSYEKLYPNVDAFTIACGVFCASIADAVLCKSRRRHDTIRWLLAHIPVSEIERNLGKFSEAIIAAIKGGDLAVIKIIGEFINYNIPAHYFTTLMKTAILYDRHDIITFAIDLGLCDEQVFTRIMLDYSCAHGDEASVGVFMQLLYNDSIGEATASNIETLVSHAILFGRRDIIEYLMQYAKLNNITGINWNSVMAKNKHRCITHQLQILLNSEQAIEASLDASLVSS